MIKTVALLAVLAATPTKHLAPEIISDTQGDNYCSTDPKPCYARIIVVSNPFRRPVVISLTCGIPGLQLDSTIPARGTGTFEMTTDIDGGLKPGQCRIAAWVK